MGTYDTAKICIDGHMITDSMELSNNTDNNCTLCGASVITKCPVCNAHIHGYYNIPGSLIYKKPPIPAYCHHCGKPYPWTKSRLATATNIIDMVNELTVEQKQQLKDFIPDIIIETPRSPYAALVFGNLMPLAKGLTREAFKSWCKENVLPKLISFIDL